MSVSSRLSAQMSFLLEVDRLKSVLRASSLCDGSRKENSAEHSWHIALYAMTLAEHAVRPVNIDRVIKMLLIHDLVEIDAGDVPIHNNPDPEGQAVLEQKAATRIFGQLPEDQAHEFRSLWDEFEAVETDDAIFAKSIDRVQPVISNLENGGESWIEFNVTKQQVETRVGAKVERGAPAIWQSLKKRIDAWFAEK